MNKINLFFFVFLAVLLGACQPKYGKMPSETTMRGLKRKPKSMTEKSYANDSLLKMDQPNENTRTILFDKKGNIVKSFIYENTDLQYFTEKAKNIGDTLISNSFIDDTTQISIIKQWKTSDSTFELHEYFMEEGNVVGEISSMKTWLNQQNLPEKEEIITETGFAMTTENIYSDYLLINQIQTTQIGWSVSIMYRYLEFDHQNNWTKRQCIVNEGSGSEYVEYQIRAIEYFD